MKIYFLLALGLLFAVACSLPLEEEQDGNSIDITHSSHCCKCVTEQVVTLKGIKGGG